MNPKGNLLRICLLGVTLLLPAVVQAQFTFTTNNGAITITGYTGANGTAIIPNATNGYPISSIASFAFYGCSSLTNLTLGTNVASIGQAAFYGCGNLSSLIFPNSLLK